MTTRVMPNGVSTAYEYDGLSRLTRLKHAKDTTTLFDYQYTHNTAQQITAITEPSKTRTFGYDNAYRLTSATSIISGQNESYTFDDVGNRTSSHLSSVYGYQQGSFNRLASTQQASYSFDNNGNLTSKTEGTAKWYYSYDRENRLMNAARFGGLMPRANESVIYQYDAFGRRVVRQDKKTGRTEFTHDGMDVLQDRKSNGEVVNYVNSLGIDNKLKVTTGTTSKYFLTDHLGSTTGLTDSNGVVTESASYDSFGRTVSSNLTTRYQYTGREADEYTGLMFYRARFYDPQIGRFISEDPIGFRGGINWYSYVENNPIQKRDPFGLESIPALQSNMPKKDNCNADSCRRDMEKMIAIFWDTVVMMNQTGRRVQGSGFAMGLFNNFSWSVNGIVNSISQTVTGTRPSAEIEGCIGQAVIMLQALDGNSEKYENKWSFDIGHDYFFGVSYHKWVIVKPIDPKSKCPSLRFDTWAMNWSIIS